MTDRIKPSRVLTPLGIGIAFSLFGDSTLYTVLPREDIAAQAGVTLSLVGLLLGLNRLARMVSNGPVGVLFDRMPRRPIMILSLFMGAVSTLLYAIGYGPGILILARILWGICWSGIWIGGNTMALDISNDKDRGRINGRLQMWFFFGVALTNFSGGLFTDALGYREGLWLSAGLTFLAAVMWLFLLPETRKVKTSASYSIHGNDPINDHFPLKKTIQAAVPLFTARVVYAGVIASTTILWLQQFIDGGIQLSNRLIPLATVTGMFSAMRVVVSILSAPAAGKVSDFLGKRWGVIASMFLVGVIGMAMMSSGRLSIAVIGAILSAVSGGAAQAMSPSLIGDAAQGNQHGRALSIAYTIGDFGSAIGPPLALFLIPLYSIRTVYILCSLLFLLSFVYSLFMVKQENNHQQR